MKQQALLALLLLLVLANGGALAQNGSVVADLLRS